MSEDSGNYTDSEIALLNIKCKCPCGNRNFRHCVLQECLKLHKANVFPELDLREGADERQKTKAQHYMEHSVLAEETRKLKTMFQKFGMALRRTLKDVPDIKESLQFLVQLLPEAIVESSDYNKLFRQATKDADFINYEPLKTMVEECACGNQAAEKLLKEYQDAFCVYAQHRIFSFPEGSLETRPPIEVGKVILKIKIEEDFRNFKIGRIEHFKMIAREILTLDVNAQLLVRTVREGCVEITFDMFEKDADKAFSNGLTTQQKRELASHKISMLECNAKVYYCCCSLTVDQVINCLAGTFFYYPNP